MTALPKSSFSMVQTGVRQLDPRDLPIPDIDDDSSLFEYLSPNGLFKWFAIVNSTTRNGPLMLLRGILAFNQQNGIIFKNNCTDTELNIVFITHKKTPTFFITQASLKQKIKADGI